MFVNSASGARFVITGGAGFVGSHLAETLVARGHRVLAVDDLSAGDRANLATVSGHPRFSVRVGDVTRPGVLDQLCYGADVIVHLAAAVGVRRIVDQPKQTIRTNLDATERALDAAERHHARILIASSSEVYGKSEATPFREQDDVLLGPTNKSRWSYAASKMIGEFLAMAYPRESGVDAVSMRFFNTIGPHQSARYGMVVPRFVRQALAGDPITVYGDGSQTRCFCDVRDVVKAIALLGESPAGSGEVVNIGAHGEITILELAKMIRRITGSASEIVCVPYDRAYEPGFEDIMRRAPDTSKLERMIPWRPRYTLEDTLEAIIAHECVPAAQAAIAGD
ncbi:MAG: GDP-mannose 4,6-dehydratase [Bryobacterales bacterium]